MSEAEQLRKALAEIVKLGHGRGHGFGYTCANIAEKALKEIACEAATPGPTPEPLSK